MTAERTIQPDESQRNLLDLPDDEEQPQSAAAIRTALDAAAADEMRESLDVRLYR